MRAATPLVSHKREYALFPGCMISLKFPQFELATNKVLEMFNIKTRLLEEVTCCPEPISMQMLSPEAWYTIAARNICLAETIGLDIITICNGCNLTLSTVNKELRNDTLRMKVNEKLKSVGKQFLGNINVKSILRVLHEDIGLNEIQNRIKNPLDNVRVGIHYGCHMLEEMKEYDDVKHPRTLEDLVRVTGAKVVSYPSEMLCCGSYVAKNVDKNLSFKLIEEKMNDLINAGVDCLTVVCPYCFSQYELGQISLAGRLRKQIPIIYYTQLLGLSLGFSAREMGLELHKIKADRLVEKHHD